MFKTRFTRRGTIIAALAAGLVIAAPTAAQAHVGVSPDALGPEDSAVLTFSFTHGCEDSPTTALRITMPEGLASVSPTVDALWNVVVDRADNGLVSAVTYTATTPIPHDLRGAVTMSVRLGEDTPEQLAFPVEQQCETGVNEWVEIAEDGQDPHDLESPAPVVTVSDAAGGEQSSGGQHTESEHAETESAAEDTTDPTPVVGVALGAAGLLAGIVALVITIRTSRRSAR